MKRFDDFDAFGVAVTGASLRLVCDSVDTGLWTIGAVDLGGVTLQVASEGGGNLCFGGNTHAGQLLFVPLSRVAEHVANGQPLDEESLFSIPRGADFRISIRKWAHAWCSIALPFDVAAGSAASGVVACPAGSVPRLRRMVAEIVAGLMDRPAGTAAHFAAGREIVAAALDCLPAVPPAKEPVGRPRIDRDDIVRRTMERLDSTVVVPTAMELAGHIGVTSRTLLRAFQESFGVPPKRYLMLRELHAVRRSLRDGAGHADTVADVLTRHGIWEFGRFASRYRQHFGESPSDTLRCARG